MNKHRILFIIIFVLLVARPAGIFSQSIIQYQRKLALVIGNGNYKTSTLANPENDARSMKEALQEVGFTVFSYENLDQAKMKKAIDEFGANLKNNEVGLFYYAGHGVQAKGYNYLIPTDAELKSEQQVEYDCVQADRVLALMEASGAKINILILDACRNNPFERSWTRSATGRGLAFMNSPSGTLVAYATSPGTTASDGSGNNGLYTAAILENIKIPDITILQMFQNVRAMVSEKSNKQQIPWESTSLTGDFYFKVENKIKPETVNNQKISVPVQEPVSEKKPEATSAVLLTEKKADTTARKSSVIETPDSKSQNSFLTSLAEFRDFSFSFYSLCAQVKSFEEKTFTVSKSFGDWAPKDEKRTMRVKFDDNGYASNVYISYKYASKKEYAEALEKNKSIFRTTYKPVSRDTILVNEFLPNGKSQAEYPIILPNDSTIILNKESFFIHDRKIVQINFQPDKKKLRNPNINSILSNSFTYNKNGFIEKIRENGTLKSGEAYRFEYKEFDKQGNWTKRYEFEDSSPVPRLTIRTYVY
jgi:hypothetical protein